MQFIFLPRLHSSLDKVEGSVLFLQSKITESLGGSGYNTERLATPYVPQYTGKESKTSRSDAKVLISLGGFFVYISSFFHVTVPAAAEIVSILFSGR